MKIVSVNENLYTLRKYEKIQLGILNDYYGKLLNPYQSEVMRMYCDCDMSLAEIMSELDITRQELGK